MPATDVDRCTSGAEAVIFLYSAAFAASYHFEVFEFGTGLPVASEVVVEGNSYVSELGVFDLEIASEESIIVILSPLHDKRELSVSDLKSKIWMKAELPPHEIVVEAEIESEHTSRQLLDKERVERAPGTHDDPIRLLQSLAGVAITPEYSPSAGAVILRAAAPGESRVLIDGVDVPYLYHFQQYASIIQTRSLSEVNLYSSAFSAVYGDAIGGVVDISTRAPQASTLRWASNVNFIMAGAFAEVPLNSSHVSLSARRSHADLYEDGNEQYSLWPRFWDYQVRHSKDFGSRLTLGVSMLGAGDRYARLVADTERLNPHEQSNNPNFLFDRSFHLVSGHLQYLDEELSVDAVASLVGDAWNGTLPDAFQEQNERYLWVRIPARIIAGEHFSFSLGTESKLGLLDLLSTATNPELLLLTEAPLLAQGKAFDSEERIAQAGLWSTANYSVGDFIFSTGFRADVSRQQGWYGVDPRLSFQWRRGYWGLRGAWGEYSQGADPILLASLPELPISRARHGALGVDYAVAQRWELELNGWYRAAEDLIRYAPDADLFLHDGLSYGVELLSRYRIKERFFSWFSLAYSHAEESSGELTGLSIYHQPVQVNFVASWRPENNLEVAVRYRYGSGSRYFEPTGSVYMGGADEYRAQYGELSNAQLPDYQKLDLHLGKQWWGERSQVTIYGELWWVPRQSNVLYPTYNFDYSETSLVVGPPIFPLLGLRVEN